MRGPGAQRKKITALFGGIKEAIKEAFDHSFNIKYRCILSSMITIWPLKYNSMTLMDRKVNFT